MPTKRRRRANADYSGYFLAFEPRRTEKILEQLHSRAEAAESFSAMDWEFELREVVFLSLVPGEHSISGAVLMERMHGSGGTGKLKMRLSDPVLFDQPLEAQSLSDILTLGEHVSTAENLKRFDVSNWTKLVSAIKQLRPESAGALDALLASREEDKRLSGDSVRIARLVEQRDAVGLTLDIANLDRKKTLRSLDTSRLNEANSVLDLLDAEPVHEQDLIRHDEAVFKELLEPSMRHGQFRGAGDRSVRIHVYDKKPLETVLGIDLLIYQELYRSFVLIQYKAMELTGGKRGQTWSFLVDPQMRKQLHAMGAAEAAIKQEAQNTARIWDWRLYASPFYFKFCERTKPDARDDSLVRGITLGVEHLRCFLSLPESIGERDGNRIGYENCPRYLSNTQFVDLAREGWIGSDPKWIALITELLKENQRGGKVTMLAAIQRPTPVDARHRGRQWV